MSTARSLFDPNPDDMVSLPLPALRLLLGGRAEQSADEELTDITEQIALLHRDLQDEGHWRQLAAHALDASPEQQQRVRRIVQGTTRALDGLPPLKESTTAAQEPGAAERVRPALDLLRALHLTYQLYQGILGLYDDLPPELVQRAHQLRWDAARDRAAKAASAEGLALLSELDVFMRQMPPETVVDVARSVAQEKARYEAYVAAGGEPESYDPSQP